MKITKFKKSAAVLSATTVVALAGPAAAAPPYNIDVGPFTTGNHPFTGLTKGAISFIANGPTGLVPMSCAGSTATGTVTAGPDADGLNIARITNTTWTKPCVAPGGLQLNVNHAPGSTWVLNATGVATNPLVDNVAGYVNAIDARITSKPAGLCSFRVTGRADATFREVPKTGTTVQQLSVNESYLSGNLVISNVVGCFGLVANGNTASFTGDYDITSPDGFINLKP